MKRLIKFQKNIKEEGWSLMGIRRIDESIKKHGQKNRYESSSYRVVSFRLCQCDYF